MPGKRRKKLKLLNDTITDSRRTATEVKNEKLELQTWSDLPVELLELIFSRLTLDNNIRASAVCKSWNSVATAVRVLNQSPWLMYFPKFGDCYDFYDPVQRNTYSLQLPELSGSRVCYTKDDTIRVSSGMTGENKTLLKTYGLNHHRTSLGSHEEF
ncbi:putative F-box domain-containing protein [Lupinus albus]|uniref:Putative F-box domain-containing protein n=1 Tax=Lupinus albus TaxID=3870 RepID=A0A6A4QEY7_LUPAL|nr:putative F-box domain-containing protein [Lupinus albus]